MNTKLINIVEESRSKLCSGLRVEPVRGYNLRIQNAVVDRARCAVDVGGSDVERGVVDPDRTLDRTPTRMKPGGWIVHRNSPKIRRLVFACAILLGASIVFIVATARFSSAATDDRNAARRETATDRVVPEELNFAAGLYQQRRYDLAAEEYQKFLARNPNGQDAADALYGLAGSKLMISQYEDARAAYREFLKRAPGDPRSADVLYRVGETSALLGDLKVAKQSLEDFTRRTPKHRFTQAAWVNLGEVDYKLGEHDKACDAYRKALEIEAKGRLADRSRFGLGLALAAIDRSKEAIQVLGELAEQGGIEWRDRAWNEIGRLHVRAGKDAEAVAAFESVERAAPKSRLIAVERIDRALALSRLGKNAEAETLIKPLVQDGSRNIAARAWNALGLVQRGAGKNDEAFQTFDQAAKSFADSPIAPELAFHAAEAARDLGKTDDARGRFVAVAEKFPADPWADDALLRAASIDLEARRIDLARKIVDRLISKYPKSTLVNAARLIDARAALASRKPKEAIEILSQLLERGRPDSELGQTARYYLSLAYRDDGQAAKSTAILESLVKTPATAIAGDALFLTGQARFESKQYAESIDPLERYLKENPKGDVADHAWAYLAIARWELGREDSAIEAFEKLKEEFPKSETIAPTALRLAESSLEAKKLDRAESFFAIASGTATAASGLKPKSLSGYGWTLYHEKKYDDAATAFGKLVDESPDDPLAAEGARMKALSLESAGKTEQALSAYAIAIVKYASDAHAGSAALARARLLAKAKKPADAARAYADFLRDHPKGIEGVGADLVLAEQGWTLLDADQPEQADKAFEKILKEFPRSPRAADAALNLAESAYQGKRYERSIELLRPIVSGELKSDDVITQSALYRTGRSFVELGKRSDAAKAFDRLIADFPAGAFLREARFWRAEIALEEGDAKTAESGFAAILDEKRDPASPPEAWIATARLRRVQALVALERWNDALKLAEAFRSEFSDHPLSAEIDYARGRALQQTARFDEARSAYENVLKDRKLGELAAKAQFMIGETYFHQKNYKEALRALLKVDILYDAPKWQAAALLEAGKAQELMGRYADAAETYDRLIAKFPKDESAARAEKRKRDALDRTAKTERGDSAVE